MVATAFVKHRGVRGDELEVCSSYWARHRISLPGCTAPLSLSWGIPALYMGAVPGAGAQQRYTFPLPWTRSRSDHSASTRAQRASLLSPPAPHSKPDPDATFEEWGHLLRSKAALGAGPGPHCGWHKTSAPTMCCCCQGPQFCQMKPFPLILLALSFKYCLSGLFSLPFRHLNNNNTDVTKTNYPPSAARAFVAMDLHCGCSSGWCLRGQHKRR